MHKKKHNNTSRLISTVLICKQCRTFRAMFNIEVHVRYSILQLRQDHGIYRISLSPNTCRWKEYSLMLTLDQLVRAVLNRVGKEWWLYLLCPVWPVLVTSLLSGCHADRVWPTRLHQAATPTPLSPTPRHPSIPAPWCPSLQQSLQRKQGNDQSYWRRGKGW